MKRNEFIEWLTTESGFGRVNDNDDSYWSELVNYADNDYRYLDVYETNVDFTYTNNYWGGSSMETDAYDFEDFISYYNS